jgi:hypothetical protein
MDPGAERSIPAAGQVTARYGLALWTPDGFRIGAMTYKDGRAPDGLV